MCTSPGPHESIIHAISEPFRELSAPIGRWMSRAAALALLSAVTSVLMLAGTLTPVEATHHVVQREEFLGRQFWTNTTLSVRTVAETPFARCQLHEVRLPDGGTTRDWVVFDERSHVNVLVRTKDDNKFVVFRQAKYALADSLAPVGGFVEDGESPLATAKRELHEELGLRSTQWHELGSYVSSANRYGGRVHAYFADACVPAERTVARKGARGDLERQHVLRLSRSELQEALLAGRFGEVKWTATIALALLSTSQTHTSRRRSQPLAS